MKVLVFGGEGFTGRHFLRHLASEKKNLPDLEVCATTVFQEPPKQSGEYGGARWLTGIDASHIDDVRKAFAESVPDYVVNLVGLFGSPSFDDLSRANVVTTWNILHAVSENLNRVRRVLHIGSAAEYGRPEQLPVPESHPLKPVSPYGLTKLFATEACLFSARVKGVPVVIARPFNFTGIGMPEALALGYFERIVRDTPEGESFEVGNIESKRDFISVETAVQRYLRILRQGRIGHVYNVCSGRETSIREMLDAMIARSGKRVGYVVSEKRMRVDDVLSIYGDGRKYREEIETAADTDRL
jgi:GDP-4-dehydro-6-deoxy-D-mannose reductase